MRCRLVSQNVRQLFSWKNNSFVGLAFSARTNAAKLSSMNGVSPRQSIEKSLADKAHLAPLVLRVALGLVFLAHAYAKLALFTLPGTARFFETHGFPGWTAYPVFAVELLGGAALVLGFHTRQVSLALIPVMLGALVPHVGNGWMFSNQGGGWEFVAFLIAALTSQALLGPGAVSRSPGHPGQSALAPSTRVPSTR